LDSTTITHYGAPAQVLHWLTAILVLVAFIYGPGGSEERVYAPERDLERRLHETLGICVLALAVLRLLWRLVDNRPDPPAVPRWMSFAAKLVRAALYVLLVAVPPTAISGAWLEGHALTLLGGVAIPAPLGKLHSLGANVAAVHTWLGDAILWVAGAHAAMGLFHHYVLKDGVLLSILPHRSKSR
jgi:cytochrome b561